MSTIIPAQDARNRYTKKLVAVYKERVQVLSFLRSFFEVSIANTKEISIEVERGTEKIAVDVQRGTEGNRNTSSRSTERMYVPPYYREYMDATELAIYDRMVGTEDISASLAAEFITELSTRIGQLQDKIDRATELQCAQVFETGIVTLTNGTNINYNRKAGSKVDLTSAGYFGNAGVNPYLSLENGCKFLRQTGKMSGGVVNMIFGANAFSDFCNNPKVQDRADIRRFDLDNIYAPQRNSTGGNLVGEIALGSYKARIWTYAEIYEDASGTAIPYVNPDNIVMLPEVTKFKLVYAQVPKLITGKGVVRESGQYHIGEYMDERNTSHIFDIKAAPLAVPVAIDQIYTLKASGEIGS